MMYYKIKPEYLDLWEGGDTPSNPDRIITEEEVKMFSEEWETPVEELLEQLTIANWESIAALMDDDIREAVHRDIAPCTDREFLEEYQKQHIEKYGEEFTW